MNTPSKGMKKVKRAMASAFEPDSDETFAFDSEWTGQFQFGLVTGDLDGRVEIIGNATRFDFSWSGQDENDPVCGRGWAVTQEGELCGRIYLHLADDSSLRAIKSK